MKLLQTENGILPAATTQGEKARRQGQPRRNNNGGHCDNGHAATHVKTASANSIPK